MKSWNEGYTTDSSYITYYAPYLSPCLLRMLCVLNGADLPKRKKKEPLRYLELGFGQGLSLNIHAATHSGEFWGTDFNVDHVLFAQETIYAVEQEAQKTTLKSTQKTELDLHLFDSSFAELEKKALDGKLPQFDIITLHGIWSWVNEENRQYILNILRNSLKIGGIVYMSYNTLPGRASFTPVRDLLMMHADTANTSLLDSSSRTQKALDFVTVLSKSGASYFTQNKAATDLLNGFKNQKIESIVHEYMNVDWHSFYFKDVAESLNSAKCSFLGSTSLLTQMGSIFPPKTLSLITKAPTISMRETIRDFALNQEFRADLFIKDKQNMSLAEQIELLNTMPICLRVPVEDISFTVQTPLNQIALDKELYTPILNALAENNYTPKTFEYLSKHPACNGVNDETLLEVITILLGAEYIHPTQEIEEAQKITSSRLNQFFCKKSRTGTYSNVLASPLFGSGVAVSRFDQLFLDAQVHDLTRPEEWAAYAFDILKANNEAPTIKGKPLDDASGKEFLTYNAQIFEKKRMPFLRAMGVLGFLEE